MSDYENPMQTPLDEEHLRGLADLFEEALEARRSGKVDLTLELLRRLLRDEPRLAEPRIELANLLISLDQPEEAAEQAREAIRILDNGGQWTEAVPESVLLSLACTTLGAALTQAADKDEVVFGPVDRWKAMMEEAKAAFHRAATLDPENEHAADLALGFGAPATRSRTVEESPAPSARWTSRRKGSDESADEEQGDEEILEGIAEDELQALLRGVVPEEDLVELVARHNAPTKSEGEEPYEA